MIITLEKLTTSIIVSRTHILISLALMKKQISTKTIIILEKMLTCDLQYFMNQNLVLIALGWQIAPELLPEMYLSMLLTRRFSITLVENKLFPDKLPTCQKTQLCLRATAQIYLGTMRKYKEIMYITKWIGLYHIRCSGISMIVLGIIK